MKPSHAPLDRCDLHLFKDGCKALLRLPRDRIVRLCSLACLVAVTCGTGLLGAIDRIYLTI